MQIGHHLEFRCIHCEGQVIFSVIIPPTSDEEIHCCHCEKKYAFQQEALQQLHLFETLCRQIHKSRPILSQTCIAVDVAGHQVKIPFNLLLTRLNSIIDMTIENKKIEITFRINPVEEIDGMHKPDKR